MPHPTSPRSARIVCASLVLVILFVSLSGCQFPWSQASPSSVSKDIKAAGGGTLVHPSGASFTIPASALAADATVTLSDNGKPIHRDGDPLEYISDAFSVTTKGANGSPVQFKVFPVLTFTLASDAAKNAQNLIVAEVDAAQPAVIQLHHALPASTLAHTDTKQTSSAGSCSVCINYAALASRLWVVRIPALDQPLAPTEKTILQVPWYDQSGIDWCVPTSLTEMLRYYDFQPKVNDPLVASFGGSKALANWQIAGRSGQPTWMGTYPWVELNDMGLQPAEYNSGVGYVEYEWDDDFVVTAIGVHGNYTDFQTYVILANAGGLSGLIGGSHPSEGRPIELTVDFWVHAVVIVGADSDGLYIHNSNGDIARRYTWDDFQQQARGWRRAGDGQPYEAHIIRTDVVYGYPIRPETQRRGSVVITPNDISSTDGAGSPMGIEWDGASPHTHGYYVEDPSYFGHSRGDLGYSMLRGAPLHYRYRIANVTNVPLTFKSVAELSGPNYGDGLVSQAHTTTIQPYSLSGDITGSFPQLTASVSAIFDVKLFETDDTSVVQDVKFVRYLMYTSPAPHVWIALPANGTHVYAGSGLYASADVVLDGAATDAFTNLPLPAANLSWSTDGLVLGTGTSITQRFLVGSYTITLKATNAAGVSALASISLIVDRQPPPGPSPTPAPPAQLVVSPTGVVYVECGPISYPPVTVHNSGGQTLTWHVTTANALALVTVSPTGGSLGAGQTQTLTVTNSGINARVDLNFTSNGGSATISFFCRPHG